MSSERSSFLSIVLLVSIVNSDKLITKGNKTENVWRTAGKLTGLLIQSCMQVSSNGPQEQFLLILERCLKRRSLVVLDRSLKADVIKLTNGIELVRHRKEDDSPAERKATSDVLENDWKNQIWQRIAHVLDTHILKISLPRYGNFSQVFSHEQARGRRRHHNMLMSLLMFAIAAVGLIMVPMGFQFLAVLGGKALLLAKMALILSAIQGLKKIATSNFNYGLYATPPELQHGHGHWHYDRQWPYEPDGQNYYDIPEQRTDLLHPRLDTFHLTEQ